MTGDPLTTSYDYDDDGNGTSLTSPNGYTTTYQYDHLGRLTMTTQPTITLFDGTTKAPTQAIQYDGEGNVVRTTDGNLAPTINSYDPLGRLVATTNPVSVTTLYTYTATAEQAVRDGQGNVTREQYDGAGRLITVTDPLTGTTGYQ
jgi:YD repeat-containing protein